MNPEGDDEGFIDLLSASFLLLDGEKNDKQSGTTTSDNSVVRANDDTIQELGSQENRNEGTVHVVQEKSAAASVYHEMGSSSDNIVSSSTTTYNDLSDASNGGASSPSESQAGAGHFQFRPHANQFTPVQPHVGQFSAASAGAANPWFAHPHQQQQFQQPAMFDACPRMLSFDYRHYVPAAHMSGSSIDPFSYAGQQQQHPGYQAHHQHQHPHFHHPQQHHSSGAKRFQCEKCGFCTDLLSNLQFHRNEVHRALDHFACNLCPFVAGSKAVLSRHVWAEHLKLDLVHCSICEFSTSSHSLLQAHVERTHCSPPVGPKVVQDGSSSTKKSEASASRVKRKYNISARGISESKCGPKSRKKIDLKSTKKNSGSTVEFNSSKHKHGRKRQYGPTTPLPADGEAASSSVKKRPRGRPKGSVNRRPKSCVANADLAICDELLNSPKPDHIDSAQSDGNAKMQLKASSRRKKIIDRKDLKGGKFKIRREKPVQKVDDVPRPAESDQSGLPVVVKRKRGRPRKHPIIDQKESAIPESSGVSIPTASIDSNLPISRDSIPSTPTDSFPPASFSSSTLTTPVMSPCDSLGISPRTPESSELSRDSFSLISSLYSEPPSPAKKNPDVLLSSFGMEPAMHISSFCCTECAFKSSRVKYLVRHVRIAHNRYFS